MTFLFNSVDECCLANRPGMPCDFKDICELPFQRREPLILVYFPFSSWYLVPNTICFHHSFHQATQNLLLVADNIIQQHLISKHAQILATTIHQHGTTIQPFFLKLRRVVVKRFTVLACVSSKMFASCEIDKQ